ncbi:MAG: WD40/YVTN/BNR-like repeat-containing protein [Acidimicrobiales bacterium]
MNSSPLNFGYLGEIDATSAGTAYVVGTRSPLLVTRDGGASWQAQQAVGDVTGGSAQVVFFDSTHGVVLGRQNTATAPVAIWHTSDGGVHWTTLAPVVASI